MKNLEKTKWFILGVGVLLILTTHIACTMKDEAVSVDVVAIEPTASASMEAESTTVVEVDPTTIATLTTAETITSTQILTTIAQITTEATTPESQTNDKLNGFHTIRLANGDSYAGNFVDGVRSGKGSYVWVSNDMYVGNWENNVMSGNGVYRWADDTVYEGEFINGVPSGNGKYVYPTTSPPPTTAVPPSPVMTTVAPPQPTAASSPPTPMPTTEPMPVQRSSNLWNDDYPTQWRNKARQTTRDDWGVLNRECTSFVCWRLSSMNGFELQAQGLEWNAVNWAKRAREMGVAVDNTPAVGSIAWWDNTIRVGRGWGHVAWVAEVDGDYVTLEEYNRLEHGKYEVRVIHKSEVDGFIHFKDIKSTGSYYSPTAMPKVTPLMVGNKVVNFNIYTIDSVDYFNVRDIAYVFHRTEKQFNVVWQNGALYLETGYAYRKVGGEMESKGSGEKTATRSLYTIYVLGRRTAFNAYIIDDNFYCLTKF